MNPADGVAYPFREALLALWSVDIDRFPPSEKLEKHHSKGINIGFVGDLTTLGVLGRQVSAFSKSLRRRFSRGKKLTSNNSRL